MESRSRTQSGIFEGPTLEKVDDRFDYGEIRVYAIGIVNDLEITLIYTDVRRPNGELFRHGGQNGMSEKRTGKASAKGDIRTGSGLGR